MEKEYKRIIGISISREIWDKLEEICKAERRNRSNAVTVAIEKMYESLKKVSEL